MHTIQSLSNLANITKKWLYSRKISRFYFLFFLEKDQNLKKNCSARLWSWLLFLKVWIKISCTELHCNLMTSTAGRGDGHTPPVFIVWITVNIYVALFKYLSADQLFTLYILREPDKSLRIFCVKKKLTFLDCIKFYAYSMSACGPKKGCSLPHKRRDEHTV